MRYQKAKRIGEILPLLCANDKETVLLGITLLKNEPIIVNLNKHYKQLVSLQWPGFWSDCPEKFKTFQEVRAKAEFSKKVLDYVFNIINDDHHFNLHILSIICWIFNYCGWEKQYRGLKNYKYIQEVGYDKIIKNKNYNELFNNFFHNRYHDNQFPESAPDYSQDAKNQRIFKIKKHTKRPWQDNRKYNTRRPMNCWDYLDYIGNISHHNFR